MHSPHTNNVSDDKCMPANSGKDLKYQKVADEKQGPMFQHITQKLITILYKLESTVESEILESNQLFHISALESLYSAITKGTSESQLMPS